MRRLLVVATSVAMLASAGAFAGEVKGPPGTVEQHERDRRARSRELGVRRQRAERLRPVRPEGQTVSQVQTAADSWKYYGLPKGAPGKLGLCKGGTGER